MATLPCPSCDWLATAAPMLSAASACGVASGPSSSSLARTSAGAGIVLTNIPLPEYATDVAVRADGARVCATAQSVFALDLAREQLVTRIPVGTIQRPMLSPSVAVSRDGDAGLRHARDQRGRPLARVDTASNTIVADHFLPIHPIGVAAAGAGRVIAAGCKLTCIDGTLLILAATSLAIVSQIALASAPSDLVLAHDGSRAYLANGRDASVGVIDVAAASVTTVTVGAQPLGVVRDSRGAFLYVANFGDDSVSAVDTRTSTVVATVPVPRGPRAIAVSPDGGLGYVAHSSGWPYSTCAPWALLGCPGRPASPMSDAS
jgi:YVTN family beta-propeller protein